MKHDRSFDVGYQAMPKPLQRVADRLPGGDPASRTRVEYVTLIQPMGKALETSIGETCVPDTYEPPIVGLPTILCDEKVMVAEVESVQQWHEETQRMMTHHTVRLRADFS